MRRTPPLVVLVLGGTAGRWECSDSESPLAVAQQEGRSPTLSVLAEEGRVLGARLSEDAQAAVTAAPLLSILGVDPAFHETAPASYVGAWTGSRIGPDECFVSADFVALFRDTVADVEPGPLRHAESLVLRRAAGRALERAGFRFLPGRGSSHAAIAPRGHVDDAIASPDFVLGGRLARLEPRSEPHALAHRFARETLDNHEVNAVRRDLGENGADMVWLSGPGGSARVARTRHKGAAFGVSLLWQSVCRARGLDVRLPGARTPGPILKGIAQALRRGEDAFLYSGRGVRDARTGRLASRVDGIGDLDEHLIAPLAQMVRDRGARLVVLPDHARDTETGLPVGDPVPVLAWGDGIAPVAERPFSETGARSAGDPVEPAHELLTYLRQI